jgi:hypothetical protein
MKATNTQVRVNKLVAAFLSAQDDFVIGMHAEGLDVASIQRPAVIVAVCEALAGGEGYSLSSEGKPMLDTKHPQYEFLKTRVRDAMGALKGEKRSNGNKSSGKTDPVDALITKFESLTPAQRRAFLKAVA